MYLEWFEDFILRRRDGTGFVLAQVKTRDENQHPISIDDDVFVRALLRFHQHQSQFEKEGLTCQFIFAAEHGVSHRLQEVVGCNAVNPFHHRAGNDWANVKAAFQPAGTDATANLGPSLKRLLSNIEIPATLTGRSISMSRIADELVRRFSNLGTLPHNEVQRRASSLVNAIYSRSMEHYEVTTILRLTRDEVARLDSTALTRRIDADEIRSIIGGDLVTQPGSRTNQARQLFTERLARLPAPTRLNMAHALHVPVGETTFPEDLARRLIEQPIEDTAHALSYAASKDPSLGRDICVFRLLTDDQADAANGHLDANSSSALGGHIATQSQELDAKTASGQAYIESTRFTQSSWRNVSFEGGLEELSDEGLAERLSMLLREAIGGHRSGILANTLRKLQEFRKQRIVLLLCSVDHPNSVERILSNLPPDARALAIVAPETALPESPSFRRLPAPNSTVEAVIPLMSL
jgi:hypothetical protein